MFRSFVGRSGGLAVLVGCVFVAILAACSYSLVSAFRRDEEMENVYSRELFLAKSLQESIQRKLASGRGFLLAHDARSMQMMEEADIDARLACAALRSHASKPEGMQLLAAVVRNIDEHDRALEQVMAQGGSADEIAKRWAAEVAPRAMAVRRALDDFIRHKQRLSGDATTRAHRDEQQATVVATSIALVALVGGGMGSMRLLRSARERFAAETGARAAAEKERAFYTALVDQLPLGIVMAEPSGRILHLNKWGRRMLMRVDPRAADVRFVGEYKQWPVVGEDGKDITAEQLPLARALRGEVVFDESVRFGPQQRVYSVTAGPIRDQSGAIIAAVLGFSDVTVKKHAERERELFIGALGHDLRNPLNAIALNADSLSRRTDLPDDATQFADRIASASRRMNKLIGDLLDFARSQAGAIRLNPEPCLLGEVADEVVADLLALHSGREIRVEREGGCEGRWDRARLAQVMSNLVSNALMHGARDQPVVIRTGGDGEQAWARVSNQGEPIAPEELLHIFEPFRAAGKSRGTGLGLYIARSIVEAHGGTIEVWSKDNQTRFTVRLPHDPPSQTGLQPGPVIL